MEDLNVIKSDDEDRKSEEEDEEENESGMGTKFKTYSILHQDNFKVERVVTNYS